MIRTQAAVIIASLFVLSAASVAFGIQTFFPESFLVRASEKAAAVFLVPSSTVQSLNASYDTAERGLKKFTVLIVPGHDDEAWGTEFRGVREADINVELAQHLATFLIAQPEISVRMLRSKSGYDAEFLKFKETNKTSIEENLAKQRRDMKSYIEAGVLEKAKPKVTHNLAPSKAAETLYAANAWGNSLKADVVIHIHFNDVPRGDTTVAGKYTGFAMYIPEKQYSNAEGSRAIGTAIYNAIAKYYPKSDFPQEKSGIIESPDLIAVGAYNTLDAASVLIEYSYIYEPQLGTAELRSAVTKDLAYQTYRGLLGFLGGKAYSARLLPTTLVPHTWNTTVSFGDKQKLDILALQRALQIDGTYPPKGKTLEDCPVTANFGPCTEQALTTFQGKYAISETGRTLGHATRFTLNNLFSR